MIEESKVTSLTLFKIYKSRVEEKHEVNLTKCAILVILNVSFKVMGILIALGLQWNAAGSK